MGVMAGTICGSAKAYFGEMAGLLGRVDAGAVDRLGDILYQAWKDKRRVYAFGNGGSAATASHVVCDFLKTAAVEGKRRLAAISLGDNIGTLTALGNDIHYDQVFRYPLETFGEAGDVALAISCSGNSPNVLRACEWAREKGMKVVALTGCKGGKLGALADLHINIPSENYGIIEDLHLSIGHIAAQRLKCRVEGEN
jgi:D-sedoheptulose 7-phosphate isomerase